MNNHFPNRFKWFYRSLGLLRGCLGVILASILAHGSNFWGISGSLWGYLWTYRRRISCVMHVSCIHVRAWWGRKTGKVKKLLVFKSMFEGVKISTRRFGKRAVERAEPLLSYVGATLVSLFWYIRVTLGHFMIALGSLWSYFGCNKVGFQKTFIFPTSF